MARAHYAVDLARPRPRASRTGLALLALGCVAAAATGLAWQRDHAARQIDEETLARLEAAIAGRSEASRATAARVPTAGERAVQGELARLSSDLFRPWFPMLDALEASAVPRVDLQQLSVDAGFTKLQLRVDAAALSDVLRYVAALDHAGAPLHDAQLLGHEWQTAAGAPRRLQARIAVALAPGMPDARVPAAAPLPAGGPCGLGSAVRCLSAQVSP